MRPYAGKPLPLKVPSKSCRGCSICDTLKRNWRMPQIISGESYSVPLRQETGPRFHIGAAAFIQWYSVLQIRHGQSKGQQSEGGDADLLDNVQSLDYTIRQLLLFWYPFFLISAAPGVMTRKHQLFSLFKRLKDWMGFSIWETRSRNDPVEGWSAENRRRWRGKGNSVSVWKMPSRRWIRNTLKASAMSALGSQCVLTI